MFISLSSFWNFKIVPFYVSFTCDQLVCYYCRHFTLIILTNLTFGIYTAIDLNVTVFSVTKSQLNKQSVELSILLTLSKYFTNPKFAFMFDLISSLVEYNEEEYIGQKFVCLICFLLSCKRTIKNSTLAKTQRDSFCLTVRYRRYRRQD